jgi:integrase
VWWLAQVDEWLWLRRRDAAYALAGIATARRHIELEQAVLGDLTELDAGYEYVVRDHKGNRIVRRYGGKEELLTRVIGHLADDPATAPADCPAHCPACRMRDHLEIRERSGAGKDAPLFIGLDGTTLGRSGGNYVLKRLAKLVEDLGYNPDGTPRSFSTRTLRVTGATLARRAGMSFQEIADDVTGHRSEDQAALYVRRHDPFAVELVLSLDGPERPSAEDRDAESAESRNATTREDVTHEAL